MTQKKKKVNLGKKRINLGLDRVRLEIKKAVVGQDNIINSVLRALLCNCHVLLEGVPGVAKTLLLKSIATTIGCANNRVQCTPDLLPADIIGFTSYEKEKGFYISKGPIFSNFLLVDEINRANPKTQSAFIEAMQEKQVTIGKKRFPLPPPFFVMATQNPIESLGTYPLPEAQVDRFLFKINMVYPTKAEEQEILQKNSTVRKFEDIGVKKVLTKEKLFKMQKLVNNVFLDPKIEEYIVSIVEATRKPELYKIKLGKYVEWGGSPRASIGLFIASKAEALLNNRMYVTPQDVKVVAYDVIRHRLIMNYEGQAEGIKPEAVIQEILSKIAVP